MQLHYEFELYLRGETVEAYIPDLRAVFEADEYGWYLHEMQTKYRDSVEGPYLWHALDADPGGNLRDLDTITYFAASKEIEKPRHIAAIEALWVDLRLFDSDGARKPCLTPAHQYFGGI